MRTICTDGAVDADGAAGLMTGLGVDEGVAGQSIMYSSSSFVRSFVEFARSIDRLLQLLVGRSLLHIHSLPSIIIIILVAIVHTQTHTQTQIQQNHNFV